MLNIIFFSLIILYSFLLFKRKYSYSIICLIILLLMSIFGFITFEDILKGYSSDTIAIYFGISIITESLIRNGFINKISNMLLNSKKNEIFSLILLIISSALLSIIISSKTTIIVFINILGALEKNSKGKISKKSSVFFSLATGCANNAILVFSTKLLLANEILLEFGKEALSIFHFLPLSILNIILLVIYVLSQKNKFIYCNHAIKDNNTVNEIKIKNEYNKTKSIISLLALMSCIILPIFFNIETGFLAVCGAIICIVTNCLTDKMAISSINWNIIIYLGAIKGISKAFKNSGIADVLAMKLAGIIDNNTSVLITLVLISLVSGLISYFIDNKTSVNLLLPICLTITEITIIDPKLFVSAIIVGSYFNIVSPLDVTNNIIVQNTDVDMKYIFRIGLPYVVLIYIISIIFIYVFSII